MKGILITRKECSIGAELFDCPHGSFNHFYVMRVMVCAFCCFVGGVNSMTGPTSLPMYKGFPIADLYDVNSAGMA